MTAGGAGAVMQSMLLPAQKVLVGAERARFSPRGVSAVRPGGYKQSYMDDIVLTS